MKLVVPLSNVEQFEMLKQHGADEFYVGFMPYEWLEKYRTVQSLNRREYMFTGSNICTFDSMITLSKMASYYQTKVKITLNSHFYVDEQYDFILSYIEKLMTVGFDEFIIADLWLAVLLKEKGIPCKIHFSGEIETLNHDAIDLYGNYQIRRVVFPRKISLEDMRACIANNKLNGIEYEAFVLNSLCRYSGGFCNSIHCDNMPAVCGIPHSVHRYSEDDPEFQNVADRINKKMASDRIKNEIIHTGSIKRKHKFGSSGCGVCKIKALQNIGVTHLKIVGRGYGTSKLVSDVKMLSEIMRLLPEKSEEDFAACVRDTYIHNQCTKCYYPGEWNN